MMDLDVIFAWLEKNKSFESFSGMPKADRKAYVNVHDLKKFLKKHEINANACKCSRCTGLPDFESFYFEEDKVECSFCHTDLSNSSRTYNNDRTIVWCDGCYNSGPLPKELL